MKKTFSGHEDREPDGGRKPRTISQLLAEKSLHAILILQDRRMVYAFLASVTL
jgi:hypothetical protein